MRKKIIEKISEIEVLLLLITQFSGENSVLQIWLNKQKGGLQRGQPEGKNYFWEIYECNKIKLN